MTFFKFQKLFISLFAVIAVFLAAGHFCSSFKHASGHHTDNEIATIATTHYEQSNYQQCCANKDNGQFIPVIQQVQKFNIDQQNVVAVVSYITPTFTTTISSSLFQTVQADKLDPGGGLVLLC